MNRRIQRVGNLIRNTIGQLLLSKLSDPRIDPALTSVTRVEVSEDMLTAKVFISVLGDEAQQRTTLRALTSSAGHIQELMMRQIQLRNTPRLQFVPDQKFKKTLQTLQIIQRAMDELRRKEEASSEAKEPQGPQDASPEPGRAGADDTTQDNAP